MLATLQISDHAYIRAAERLGVGPYTFDLWVTQTRPNWLQVNAQYFIFRNVRVCQAYPLYTHAWSSTTWLCLAVSVDHTLKTVIEYENLQEIVEMPRVVLGGDQNQKLRKRCPRLARIKAERRERESELNRGPQKSKVRVWQDRQQEAVDRGT